MAMPNNNSASFAVDRLAALILLGILFFGVWQAFGSWQSIVWDKLPAGETAWRTGQVTHAFNHQFEQQLPARQNMIGLANGLRYRLTGGAGEQVFAGRDGWLFLAEELTVRPPAERDMAERLALIAGLSQSLAALDVRLVLAVVPDKARIYANRLVTAYPAANAMRYSQAQEKLLAAGVSSIDLLSPLQKAANEAQVYYRTDTHWNQRGAQVAAQALGAGLREQFADLPPTAFVTQQMGPEAERPGDLMRLMGVAEMPSVLRPSADREAPLQTQKKSEGVKALGLFDEQNIAVVLVGTSYSLRGNFHGFLQEALATEVLNVAKDGGGFLQSITDYLQDEAFASNKPRVLVWELPERFLTLDMKDDAALAKKVTVNR